MKHLLVKALSTAVIFTIVFLVINNLEVYLEQNYDMSGYRRNLLKAPVQFASAFVVSAMVMHLFSQWFHVKT
jgi:hypothetical protein